jgi:hypothetical protein
MKFPLKKITAVGFSRRNSKGKNKGLQPKFTRGNVWLKPKIFFIGIRPDSSGRQ